MVTTVSKDDGIALLIIKDARATHVFSEDRHELHGLIIDWDHDMRPGRMSATRNARRAVGRAGKSRMTNAGRNMLLAALRTLQLHVEQQNIPEGIAESFFDITEAPTAAEIDGLCELLNFTEVLV
jgi:hypothetical protein